MHPASTNRPTQAQLQFPLLGLIAESASPITPAAAAAELGERFGVALDVRREQRVAARGKQGSQIVDLWPRHVRFARQKLLERGYVHSAGYGRWAATDEGRAALSHARSGVVISVWVNERTGLPAHIEVEKVVSLPGVDALASQPTHHTLHLGDARDLSWIGDGHVALVATSMPYFDLKEYDGGDHQLHRAMGRDLAYEGFLAEFDQVLRECLRVLMPGGRMVLNVGDVLRSRKRFRRHHLLPLHADVMVRGREIGFDNLTPILWRKVANVAYEQGAKGMLGKPYEPNGVITQDVEYILNLRKPGGYRAPTPEQRQLSKLSKADYGRYFRSMWDDIPGVSTRQGHPAPWPTEVPYRLIRMFSFVGDTVLDPFSGTFRTSEAAMRAGRHSVGNEIVPHYMDAGANRVVDAARSLALGAA
jgi:DNA modification methylase